MELKEYILKKIIHELFKKKINYLILLANFHTLHLLHLHLIKQSSLSSYGITANLLS